GMLFVQAIVCVRRGRTLLDRLSDLSFRSFGRRCIDFGRTHWRAVAGVSLLLMSLLLGLFAWQSRELGQRKGTYSWDMAEAAKALEDHDYGTVKELLERHNCGFLCPNYRDDKWYVLEKRFHPIQ